MPTTSAWGHGAYAHATRDMLCPPIRGPFSRAASTLVRPSSSAWVPAFAGMSGVRIFGSRDETSPNSSSPFRLRPCGLRRDKPLSLDKGIGGRPIEHRVGQSIPLKGGTHSSARRGFFGLQCHTGFMDRPDAVCASHSPASAPRASGQPAATGGCRREAIPRGSPGRHWRRWPGRPGRPSTRGAGPRTLRTAHFRGLVTGFRRPVVYELQVIACDTTTRHRIPAPHRRRLASAPLDEQG